MPPIVDEGTLNLAALQVDDVYAVIVPPQTPLITGSPTDGVGLVGTAGWGPFNTPTPVGDVASLVASFGDIDLSAFDLVTEAIGALKQGASNLWLTRVSDGADAVATAQALDAAAAGLVNFSAFYSGKKGNSLSVVVGVGSNSTALPAVGTATLGGTWAPGDTATITVGGNAVVYTTVAGDTPQTIAAALAAKLNATAAVAKLVSASASGAVVTLVAVTRGTAGNAITLTATKTSGAGTNVASGANLATGAGTQTYKVSVALGSSVAEIFDNISGVAGQGASSAAAAIVAAVTNGTASRGPSTLVSAVLTPSGGSAALVNQALAFTGGLDGRAGVTSTTLVGVDGLTRTGMYALRGTPIAQFGLCGNTDATTWALQIGFAQSEAVLVVLPFAVGTTSLGAVSAKNGAAVDDYHAAMVKDWLYLNDTFNKQIRLVSPLGPTLGRIAALSPERSPGNKPVQGFLGTERTGFVGPGGSFRVGTPYSTAEIALLESAGVLFMTSPAVGGNYLALRHGQNASSDPTRNGINYSRMTPFLAKSMKASLGFAVNEVHTPELRRRIKSALSQFLTSLASPGPGRAPMIGDVNGGPAYSVVCDATNNHANTVANGYLFVSVQVKLLSIVRFFVISIEAGQSVTVRVANTPLSQAA